MRAAITHAATLLCVSLLVWTLHAVEPVGAGWHFSSEIERLSEAGGTFDTDNLISNESSYLDVMPELMARGVAGGAYLGVGPDQNFTYIAQVRPAVAYIVDIRRDNLLLHLLFKALFASAPTRVVYLSMLTGRAPPTDLELWKVSSIATIADYIDRVRPDTPHADAERRRLEGVITGFGVPLSRADLDTIARFHRAFIDNGLDLVFETFGRSPQPSYPNFRELLLATDPRGRTLNYLASEDDYQFLRSLQERDAIVPVVGNLAGQEAMVRIADAIAARGDRVSAVYLSNVESYVRRAGLFDRMAENLVRLPHDANSVVIRSIFGSGGASRSAVDSLSQRYDRPRPRSR